MLTLPHNLSKITAALLVGLVLTGLAVTACSSAAAPTPTITTQQTLNVSRATNPSSAVSLQGTPSQASPTPGSTPTPTHTQPDVIVWWPAALEPEPDSTAEMVLRAQIEDFQNAHGLLVQWRAKRLNGAGGIMSTLRTASAVAPGALPDLVLLRREQLLIAVDTGLIYPPDDLLAVTTTGGIYNQALALGQVNGTLYGIPYTVTIQHSVYRESLFNTPPTSFAAVLDAAQPFAFPAAPTEGVSQTVLLQYLAAGGRLAAEDGSPLLDEEPLAAVLAFYEAAVADELLAEEALAYQSTLDYWADFLSGELGLAVIDSNTYLGSLGQVPNVSVAPIWTSEDSTPLTTLDGWLWAITTTDPDRQAQAAVFLDWIMQADRQASLAQNLGRLSSRPWDDDVYSQLVRELLDSEQLIVADEINAALASTLQNALLAVLNGEASASEAAAAAVAAFS